MRRLLLLLALCCLAPCLHAQTIAQYLQLRKANGITQPTSLSTLETTVGERVAEVSVTVKGSFRVGDRGSLMVDKPGGGTDVIDCDSIPDWLVGNEVKARLLLKVTREDEASEMTAVLLCAAPEDLVAPHDKAPSVSIKSRSSRSTRGLASRHGTREIRKEWVLPKSQVTPIYASYIKSYNPRLTDEQATEIAEGVIGFALSCKGDYKIDARLIMAMIRVESGFNPGATSSKGAQGLGQLMPGTAQGLGVGDAYDTMENLYGMVRLMASNLASYRKATGDEDKALRLAVAAYNAGNGAVSKYGGIPPYAETQNYVQKVLSIYYGFLGRQ